MPQQKRCDLIQKMSFFRFFNLPKIWGILLATLLLCCTPLLSAPASHTSILSSCDASVIAPNHLFWVAIDLNISPGWHIYSKNTPVGSALTIKWLLPDSIQLRQEKWPEDSVFKEQSIVSRGYKNKAIFFAQFRSTQSIPLSKIATLSALVHYVACKDRCVPEEQVVVWHLPVKKKAVLNKNFSPPNQISFNGVVVFLTPFFLALLGGFFLNCMPCVFPVLSLKIFSLLDMRNNNTSYKKFIVSYTAGILCTMTVLSTVIFLAKLAGYSLGWGFQLQSPALITGLSFLMLILGLNMLGVFEWGLSLTRLGQFERPYTVSLWGSFLSGMLSVVVASPCTTPWMGAAMGFSLTQPFWIVFGIYICLGLGMASPFLLLLLWPSLLHYLPKPGKWMQILKEGFSFVFFGSTIWLLWILGQQAGLDVVIQTLWGLFLGGIFVWYLGKNNPPSLRLFLLTALLCTTIVFSYLAIVENHPKSVQWAYFNEETLKKSIQSTHPVLVNVTAAWCITCQVNEKRVFSNPTFLRFLKTNSVILIKADWTKKDPVITALLQQLGQNSVPLCVLYRQGKTPLLFSGLIAPHTLVEAIKGRDLL